jgi:NAD(P)-dependent dehydrogenase (short-subunit alcohol dehydrogenase family)
MKTWFITGTSRGFGREWAIAALDRGDQVAATARDTSSLADIVEKYGNKILPISLDVRDRAADFAAVEHAFARFGTVDVIVNNAGYGLSGAIEEVSEQQAREQIETNLFGALWVTQAAIPHLRKQGHGHILQVSSIGGIAAFETLGIYHASKWGLEGFSESLSKEVATFGIKVTIIEPGGFTTDWSGSSMVNASPNAAYDEVRAQRTARWSSAKRGNPTVSSDAILAVVDSANPPLRLILGKSGSELLPQVYNDRIKVWSEWSDVSRAADGL